MKPLRRLRISPLAFIYIKSTFKNTLITITNTNQEPLFQISSRSYNAKVKQKNNPYILHKVTLQLIHFLKCSKYKKLYIFLDGIGPGRYNIMKHLIKHFKILFIQDKTNVPFNGCRLTKPKRK